MSDFEPYDDELAAAMRRRSATIDPSGLSTATAHEAVLARARGIRRRRAGIAGGMTMVALVAGGFLLLGGGDDTLAPAGDPSTTRPVEPAPAPTSSVLISTTAQTEAPTSAPAQPTTIVTLPSDTSTTPASAPPATTETQTSSGGSITYNWDGSSLDLLSTEPAAGHATEIEDDTPTRIRVSFEGPNESRIEVRVEGGVPVVDID